MPTTLSDSVGQAVHHPGPLEFWVIAVGQVVWDHRLVPMLAVAAVNVVAVAAIVWIAGWLAGRPAGGRRPRAGAVHLVAARRDPLSTRTTPMPPGCRSERSRWRWSVHRGSRRTGHPSRRWHHVGASPGQLIAGDVLIVAAIALVVVRCGAVAIRARGRSSSRSPELAGGMVATSRIPGGIFAAYALHNYLWLWVFTALFWAGTDSPPHGRGSSAGRAATPHPGSRHLRPARSWLALPERLPCSHWPRSRVLTPPVPPQCPGRPTRSRASASWAPSWPTS
jgi:hypothetical protein